MERSLIDAIGREATGEIDARRLVSRWQRLLPELEAAAERIRRHVAAGRCSCDRPADPTADARCSRCYGRAGEAAT